VPFKKSNFQSALISSTQIKASAERENSFENSAELVINFLCLGWDLVALPKYLSN